MRSVYRVSLFLLAVVFLGFQAFSFSSALKEEFKKSIKKEFPISETGIVSLYNKYGKVDVKTWEKNRVKIDVTITVKAGKEADAQKVFETITIDFSSNDDFVKAQTIIDSNKGWMDWSDNKNEFTIDYQVYLPATVELDIANKYGDVYVVAMQNDMKVVVKYGNYRLEGVQGDLETELGYGNGQVLFCKDVKAMISYGNVQFNQARDMELETKYSKIILEQAAEVRTLSKYDNYQIGTLKSFRSQGKYDNVQIEQVEDLIVSSRYTDYKVLQIRNSADLDLQYGAVKLENIARGFSEVRLVGRYTDYKIHVEEGASYQLEATADYAGVMYPEKMSVTYENEKGTFHEVEGHMGTKNARSVIRARLDYGGLNIR